MGPLPAPVRRLAQRASRRSYALTRWRQLRRLRARRGAPVVIFTMGKTASTAVFLAVDAALPGRVFKVHMLRPDALAAAEREYRESARDIRPRHLFHGLALSAQRPSASRPWSVITIVRDPIARAASAFFQSSRQLGRLGDEGDAVDAAFEAFVRGEGLDHALTWFERELEPTIGVDVYAHAFDPARGFAVIDEPHAQVLVLRQENLDVAPAALAEVLGLASAPVIGRENVGAEKQYRHHYARALESVVLPDDVLDRAYGSRLVRHFYAPHEIDAFRSRWSTGRG
jgi:hypothetical protein